MIATDTVASKRPELVTGESGRKAEKVSSQLSNRGHYLAQEGGMEEEAEEGDVGRRMGRSGRQAWNWRLNSQGEWLGCTLYNGSTH